MRFGIWALGLLAGIFGGGAIDFAGVSSPDAAVAAGAMIRGIGPDSCGKFLSALGNAPPGKSAHMQVQGTDFLSYGAVYLAWIDGFVSYANLTVPELQGNQIVVDATAIDYWIRQWCAANPTALFYEAGIALVKSELARRK
jgi:hypothetical protein